MVQPEVNPGHGRAEHGTSKDVDAGMMEVGVATGIHVESYHKGGPSNTRGPKMQTRPGIPCSGCVAYYIGRTRVKNHTPERSR